MDIAVKISGKITKTARKGRLSVNLAANIANLAVTTVIGIFYVPFLVRTLGPAVYGIIPLATIITSYMGIITLSLNSAVARRITVALEQGDERKANLIFNTSLWGSLFLTAALVLPCVLGIIFVDRIVSIPNGYEAQARVLFGCIAAAFLLNEVKTPLDVATFSRNRFELRNLLEFSELIVRIGLIVALFLFLKPEVSYVGVAIFLGTVVSFAGAAAIWKQLTPTLRVDAGAFHWQSLKELTQTGTWVVVNRLGALLYLGTDLIVANRMFGPETSGRYAAILQLAIFIRSTGGSIGPVFAPTALFYYARNDISGLVAFLRWAVKLEGLLLVLPVGLTCGFAGPLLSLWLGPSFEALSPLLVILIFHLSVNLAIDPLLGFQLTADRVKTPGIVTLLGGISNLVLAVVLAKYWGIYGIAVAGAIMLTAKNALFTPVYAARIVQRRWTTFFSPLLPALLATLSVIVASRAFNTWRPVTTWMDLIAAATVISFMYMAAAYFLLLDRQERTAVNQLVTRLRPAKA